MFRLKAEGVKVIRLKTEGGWFVREKNNLRKESASSQETAIDFYHRGHREHREVMDQDKITGKAIGCMIEVHRNLGPGLLESTYQQCIAREFSLNHIEFKVEWPLPVEYKGIRLDCGYRVDLIVEDRLIIELKCVDTIKAIHEAQLLTYMKLSNIKTGLLVNFNVYRLKDGIRRYKL